MKNWKWIKEIIEEFRILIGIFVFKSLMIKYKIGDILNIFF